jgi:hypothetical protein
VSSAALTTMGEIESRIGIPPLEELLAERDHFVQQVAPLRARHGPFGSYNDLRKIELAQIAQVLRLQAMRDSVKQTEAALDEAAHADPRYVAFVVQATKEKAEWAILENQIQGIEDTINRGQAVARFAAMETALAR